MGIPKKKNNDSPIINDGESLDHPHVYILSSIYRLNAEVRCLHEIETRGAVECGVPSVASTSPASSFAVHTRKSGLFRITLFQHDKHRNQVENCSFCTGICNAGGLFPIDYPQ